LKIAHIDLSKEFGTEEQQTLALIKELSKRGIEQKLFIRKGVKVPFLDNLIEVIELSQPLCLNIFKLSGFDLIHSHSKDANRVAYLRHLFFRTPYIVTVRDSKNSCTSSAKENLNNPTEITTYNPNFVDEKMVLTLSKTYPNKKFVGFIGDFKGSGEERAFIETVRTISEANPELYFIMIGGDGDYKLKCEEFAGNLPNITLLGELKDPKHYIKQFDIVVNSSSKVNLTLDSMKLSIPIIADRGNGSESFIEDGKDGILFESKNSKELSQKIVELINSSELQKSLSSGGLRKVDNFSPKLLADRYETLYEKIVIE